MTVPRPTERKVITLQWCRFPKLTEARTRFKKTPCIYVQTDPKGAVLRIGKAEKGLEPRYRGGTGYAIDAAMYGSGNLVFVAQVPAELLTSLEAHLIFLLQPSFNNQGKNRKPSDSLAVEHKGEAPDGL